uniref:NADH-ubiquinone oxidoreductase chain 1 n=1 Tax=Magelona mirabilis TaxID=46598 RepID=A0A0S2N0E7_9ANNE|nr:NADH dehydrogenase subunit 1 [Magelona mirabilis]ALO81680.1 NADH dehydrogenase subunit 1 [Magelona mirabilis]
MLSFFVSAIIYYLAAVLAVAFFTLMERKVLGYMQIRKGPNKVGLAGVPQPFADVMKLFAKEQAKPTLANQLPFLGAPGLSLLLALILWALYPSLNSSACFSLGILMFLCVSGLNVYGTLMAGWASNSKYALLGALRAIAQTISYEVSMALIILTVIFFSTSFNLSSLSSPQMVVWFLFFLSPVMLMWLVTILAETNRAPFDFAEGESELVSGFNVEYSSGGFAVLFVAEYSNILFMSLLTAAFFLGANSNFGLSSPLLFMVKIMLVAFFFLWARGTLPRLRYDRLMSLTWKTFLPVILGAICFLLPLVLAKW